MSGPRTCCSEDPTDGRRASDVATSYPRQLVVGGDSNLGSITDNMFKFGRMTPAGVVTEFPLTPDRYRAPALAVDSHGPFGTRR